MLNRACDRFPIPHFEANPWHPRVFLCLLSQRHGMGRDPELGMLGGDRDQARQWIDQIGVQAGFRFIQREQ